MFLKNLAPDPVRVQIPLPCGGIAGGELSKALEVRRELRMLRINHGIRAINRNHAPTPIRFHNFLVMLKHIQRALDNDINSPTAPITID